MLTKENGFDLEVVEDLFVVLLSDLSHCVTYALLDDQMTTVASYQQSVVTDVYYITETHERQLWRT